VRRDEMDGDSHRPAAACQGVSLLWAGGCFGPFFMSVASSADVSVATKGRVLGRYGLLVVYSRVCCPERA